MSDDYHSLPPDLPVPEDDGAADHLTGMELPPLSLGMAGGGAFALRASPRVPSEKRPFARA